MGKGEKASARPRKGLAVKELVWGGIRVAAWRRWLSLVEKQGADTGQQSPETVKLEPAAFPGQRPAGPPSALPRVVKREKHARSQPSEGRRGQGPARGPRRALSNFPSLLAADPFKPLQDLKPD